MGFVNDLAGRLMNKVQLTTDRLSAYVGAVLANFGPFVDYWQLMKVYGEDGSGRKTNSERKYSPSKFVSCSKFCVQGNHLRGRTASTSHVERQNLNIRMGNRLFTRLTNGFSKKLENHEAMTVIQFAHHNFCRVHQTLQETPAMAQGWQITCGR
jgi:hypothetical protein